MNKTELKQKLWAAVDDLEENEGFVLVATEDEIQFTRLKAAGYSDAYLDLEPLNIPLERANRNRLAQHCDELVKRGMALHAEITEQEQRLADLNAAIANALGRHA
ncbi:hypothetical protein [Nocardia niwae]|uniref:hypothetical protein n=1 Tax=Nocardia niwae TaxID=626084 RepID=UPI0007A4CCFB|nr:hypothetical protein [Nocardia niwae]